MKKLLIIIILIISFLFINSKKVTLPPISNVNIIKLRTIEYTDEIIITDSNKIDYLLRFINSFPDGWNVPWYGPPVSNVFFECYNNDKFICNFGVSENFITRDYGNFWSQTVDKNIIKKFAENSHEVVYEALYLTIPNDINLKKEINISKQKLNELKINSDINEIYDLIKNNKFKITYDHKKFINVTIKTLYIGKYLDTVICGQYLLDNNRYLAKIRFFGVRSRMKSIIKNKKTADNKQYIRAQGTGAHALNKPRCAVLAHDERKRINRKNVTGICNV